MALGTDVINPFVFPGWSVHQELGHLTACGLSPAEAMAWTTTAAADAVGEPGGWGVIAEGARADLILLDADPLADLGALESPAIVMAGGRWWTRAELDAALEDVAAGY